jgi:hypothetical protein
MLVSLVVSAGMKRVLPTTLLLVLGAVIIVLGVLRLLGLLRLGRRDNPLLTGVLMVLVGGVVVVWALVR